MKKYIKASVTDLELDRRTMKEIGDGLYKIVRQYFSDGNYSSTRGIEVTESKYNILRYTAAPYSGYYNTSAAPTMEDDSQKLNTFRAEVRKYLKQFGVTRVKFDLSKHKVHYGYVSGPDDFPVKELRAIYFG